jgi:hypothetical protein
MRNLFLAGIATAGLAACGGGGAGSAAAPAVQGPGGRATASISFNVPVAAQQVANVGRTAQLVAPAAVKFSLFEDGVALFGGVLLAPGTYTDPSSGATATVSPGSSAAFLTVTVNVTSGAGAHKFGVVVTANDGTVIASAQGTYSLAAGGGTTPVTLALAGGIASGYIECATLNQISTGNNCANYANFDANAGLYTFTAVAADADGYPIVAPSADGAAPAFANGAFKVVESASDNPPIVTITGGPWASPGSAFAAATGSYGNHFNVRCMHTGVAQLELRMVGGAPTDPVSGYPYDPSTYPAPNAVLPAGARSPGSVSVNCTASGSLVII